MCRGLLPASESVFVLKVSAVCQKRTDSAVGQAAGPQWTRCHRGPTAFPSPIARWRNRPLVVASLQLPACLRLRPSGVARPRIRSVACPTAIGNLPSPVQKTRACALRRQPLDPAIPPPDLSQAWVLRAALTECRGSPTRPPEAPPLFSSVQPLRHLFPFPFHSRWYL